MARAPNGSWVLRTLRRFTMSLSLACDKAGFSIRTADNGVHLRLSAHGGDFLLDRIAPRLTGTLGLGSPSS